MKFILMVIITFLTMLYNCNVDEGTYYGHRIKIDSVVFQRSVLLGDTISIKFYGQIGTRSTEYFDRIEMEQKLETVTFSVLMRGYHRNSYANTTYLNGEERKFIAQQRGILQLIILQPEGVGSIVDSIIIN